MEKKKKAFSRRKLLCGSLAGFPQSWIILLFPDLWYETVNWNQVSAGLCQAGPVQTCRRQLLTWLCSGTGQRACHGGWKKAGMLVLCSPRAPWSSHFKGKVWSSEAMGRGPLQDRPIVNLVVMTMMKRAKELNQMNSELVLKTQIHWLPPPLFFFYSSLILKTREYFV